MTLISYKKKKYPLFVLYSFFVFCFFLSCHSATEKTKDVVTKVEPEPVAYALDGSPYYAPDPSKTALEKLTQAKNDYFKDSLNADHIIWYGRRLAYVTKYKEAIDVFSSGIEKFPEDARMYRHRGHRYISTRKFDLAIHDFKKATLLIDGKKNEIEPDGLPNAQNIPISTLHGNIWYHLGLSYYLQHDFPKALDAFLKCKATGTNDDNIVSSSHWIYMIHKRMGNVEEAEKVLELIKEDMKIIENIAYHKLCLFYKNKIPMDALIDKDNASSANDAILYGIANWYFYNNEKKKAMKSLKGILARDSWNSFGYIAAESDFTQLNK